MPISPIAPPEARGASAAPPPSGDQSTAEGAVPLTMIGRGATPHDVGSDRPFLLDGDRVWLVVAGQVDVFAVGLVGGMPSGARNHVMRVAEGYPLFSVGTRSGDERGLLAVGTHGTQVVELPGESVRAAATQPEYSSEIAELIDRWVASLCAGVVREAVPSRVTELDCGVPARIEARSAARMRGSVGWVRHVRGHSALLGHAGLRVNGTGYFPLSRDAWLRAEEASTIEVSDTPSLVRGAGSGSEVWAGLDRLHAIVLRYTAILDGYGIAASRDRLRRRDLARRSALVGACVRLTEALDRRAGSLVLGDVPALQGTADSDDLLFEACRIVGGALDITMRPYVRPEGAPRPQDPLAAIARASRIRARKVALREDWWRRDNGPLLAFAADGQRPGALLRRRSSGYVWCERRSSDERVVTADVAASLAPFAYTFYRPFPDVALTVRGVVAFGLRGCSRELATVVALGIVGALLGMVPSIATGMLFNSVIPGAQRTQLFQITALLLACATAAAAFNLTRSVALLRLEGKMGAAVQAAVWDRLLSLPAPFFRQYAAGELAVRAMGIDAIRQVISGTTVTVLLGGIFSLFNAGLMFRYSPPLAWRASLLILVALGVTAAGSLLQLSPQRGVMKLTAKTSGLVLQLLGGVAKLRVAGAEPHAFASWARLFSAQRRLQFRARRIATVIAAVTAGVPLASYVVIFWAAVPMLAAGGAMRTGDFLAFLSAFAACLAGMLPTCSAILSALNVVPIYEQARPILTTLPEVDVGKTDPGVLAGEIEIQHAVFRYRADGPAILRDVTLHVRPGEFLALVGPSGSGKSTVLRLLLGFESPASGAVYFDRQDLAGLDIQAVRRQIGVVLQNGRLLAGDIFTNIIGSAPATLDDAWDAAQMAGVADDIRRMPMGMHTVVSEGGGTLSGGQRQRLMIARALVGRPRIVLLDEATSALDNRTQSIVSTSLDRLNATRIVVAHRLSTVVHADRICVVDHGQVVQTGTFDELLHQGGVFAELARRQIA